MAMNWMKKELNTVLRYEVGPNKEEIEVMGRIDWLAAE